MKFYKPNPKYLEYICSFDKNIIKNRNTIGIVLRLNKMIYFLPIESIDKSDFDENHQLRKSTPALLRMIDGKTGN